MNIPKYNKYIKKVPKRKFIEPSLKKKREVTPEQFIFQKNFLKKN